MGKTSRGRKIVAWWRGLTTKKKRGLTIALASVFVTSYFLGWYLGRDMSPKYDTEGAARIFMASNLRVHSLSTADAVVSVKAGFTTYTYTLSTDTVTLSLPPAHEMAQMKPPRRNPFREETRFLALAGIVATPTGTIGALSTTTKLLGRATMPARVVVYTAAAFFLATGGVLGFWMGYQDEAAYDSPAFDRALRDTRSWRGLAAPMRDCKRLIGSINAIVAAEREAAPERTPDPAAKAEEATRSCRALLAWAMQRP